MAITMTAIAQGEIVDQIVQKIDLWDPKPKSGD
jgi:hypothetical protein